MGDKPQTDSDELVALRAKIDAFDQQILRLIQQRVLVAADIAKAKVASDADASFYRPEREAQVLRRVRERNAVLREELHGLVSDDEMVRLMREIMSTSLAAEMPMTVAYLGPEGTYTQAAVVKHFGQAVRSLDVKTIPDVFRVVEQRKAHFGVVPVENSTEGIITHTLDCFSSSNLKVCGEVQLPISHQLLSNADGLTNVQKVYAHPQALAQCREWLERYLPDAEILTASSNAEAAIIASKDPAVAAIASDIAGRLYNINILASGIEDERNNTTRFLIIGTDSYAASGEDKTTIMVSAPNKVGSLFELLKPLYDAGVDMSRIESRPSRQTNWEYVFFIDLIGHVDDQGVSAALEELKAKSAYFKLIGSYPVGVL
ncbi:chorismate mutase [Arenicella chitinivorans]|uniref:Bifunctional chorismate mutase/prephenate dehydratase n=1 Tax=Arenicella chitinivorans TaxID=1329800 RepID=A0A918RHS9_9GAMM|nr:prephenate dehydratase [Arenicella chitinivorans]GGZ99406.1 chorismate mutase [Arenicella chitinivorans]